MLIEQKQHMGSMIVTQGYRGCIVTRITTMHLKMLNTWEFRNAALRYSCTLF